MQSLSGQIRDLEREINSTTFADRKAADVLSHMASLLAMLANTVERLDDSQSERVRVETPARL